MTRQIGALRMPFITSSIGLIYILRALIALSYVPVDEVPKFEEITHDCGLVASESHVEFECAIVNKTESVVQLVSHRVSCGRCLSLEYGNKVLLPGDIVNVRVRLDTKGKRGGFEQWAAILTDSSDWPGVRIIVKGNAISVWVQPAFLDLGVIGKGHAVTRRYSVLASGHKDIKCITTTSSAPDVLKCTSDSEVPAGEVAVGVRIVSSGEVRWIAGSEDPGIYNETITLLLEERGKSYKLLLKVRVFASGDCISMPNHLHLGRLLPGATCVRHVIVRNPIGLLDSGALFVTDHKYITCNWRVDPNGNVGTLAVAITVPHVTAPELISGTILGYVDGHTKLAVPYTAYVCSDEQARSLMAAEGDR
jgi:hypothetical protein